MALDTVEEWQQKVDEQQLALIKDGPLPGSFDEGWDSPYWSELLSLYAAENGHGNDVGFLRAVVNFKEHGIEDPLDIYKSYVDRDQPIDELGIPLAVQRDLEGTLGADPQPHPSNVPTTVFDEAYKHVRERVVTATWRNFSTSIQEASRALNAHDHPDEAADDDVQISAPTKVNLGPTRVDRDVVDGWNETILKAMKEKDTAVFYELGDLVIIDSGMSEVQPYVNWAKDRQDVTTGVLTMVKKGGMFDPGRISATNVRNTSTFEAAIARFSKKKVVFV